MIKRIGAIILAAGSASRMGQQKLLMPLAGKPLLAHILETVGISPWADCIVVIGEPQADLARVCDSYGVRWVYNPEHLTGQASSISLALRHIMPNLDGFIFLLGDQPMVSGQLLQAITDRFDTADSTKSIVVSQHHGERYSPTLFGAWWRPQLLALVGDRGGRQLISKNPELVIPVEWPNKLSFFDIDTWEDYQLMRQKVFNSREIL